jgi:hypothetical protein
MRKIYLAKIQRDGVGKKQNHIKEAPALGWLISDIIFNF